MCSPLAFEVTFEQMMTGLSVESMRSGDGWLPDFARIESMFPFAP
jgi:hypothetical protein